MTQWRRCCSCGLSNHDGTLQGARDGGKIITNYSIDDYAPELELLRRLSQEDLVAALASER